MRQVIDYLFDWNYCSISDADVAKIAKEQELALWRRRASYDPMKAAMEGKRRQEEAKRMLAQQQQQSKLPERCAVFDMCYSSTNNRNTRFARIEEAEGDVVGELGGGGGVGRNGSAEFTVTMAAAVTRRQLV